MDADEKDASAKFMQKDVKRSLLALPPEALRSMIQKSSPELSPTEIEKILDDFEEFKANDPLTVLQDNVQKSGQMNLMTLAPNFEMTLYLAQATGSCIVTDSQPRWNEVWRTLFKATGRLGKELCSLTDRIEETTFVFPRDPTDAEMFFDTRPFTEWRAVMRDSFKYLSKRREGARKPNVEQNLAARFTRAHGPAQAVISKKAEHVTIANVSIACPTAGIQDHTVNRLLLMSNSEHHLRAVPMAFFLKPQSNDDEI